MTSGPSSNLSENHEADSAGNKTRLFVFTAKNIMHENIKCVTCFDKTASAFVLQETSFSGNVTRGALP